MFPDVFTPILRLIVLLWLLAVAMTVALWVWAPLWVAIAATFIVGGPAPVVLVAMAVGDR